MINIALIDDEIDILEISKFCLENNCKNEVEIHTFTDPVVFLEELDNINFSLVITDIHMPKLSGIDLYNKIRQRGHHISVIFNSGFISQHFEEIHSLLDAYYFSKPTNYDNLANCIDNILYRSQKLDNLLDKFVDNSDKCNLVNFIKRYKLIHKIHLSARIRDLISSSNSN